MDVQRRDFLKVAAATAAAATTLPSLAAEAKSPVVVVVHGKDLVKMLNLGIEKLGGWGQFFKKGMKVAIKPNVAWYSTPEQGANTAPELIRECVLQAEKAGAAKIDIPENPCSPEGKAFPQSGALKAIEGTSAKLFRPDHKKGYRKTEIPKGKICKSAEITNELLDADCLINMPVAKHHGGATLSLSMKNWMGAVSNATRRSWHRDGLHQCIADFATFLKPTLTIIDASRTMLNHGPQGPGDLAYPNELILSLDPVAADAYAATLFVDKVKAVKTPFDIGYIKIAHEMGVGCGDLSMMKIERIEC